LSRTAVSNRSSASSASRNSSSASRSGVLDV
jgi:hypothetical protein